MNLTNPLPKILVVDDDIPSSDVIRYFVKNVALPDIVNNGPSAVSKAKENFYAAILMDINLGRGMNGLDTVREIRKIYGYETTPVLALTAYAMAGDREKFLSSGCTHYLSKPFSKSELLKVLSEMIKID